MNEYYPKYLPCPNHGNDCELISPHGEYSCRTCADIYNALICVWCDMFILYPTVDGNKCPLCGNDVFNTPADGGA